MKAIVCRFFHDETGATAIEYALIAILVSTVIVGGVTAMGTKLSAKFQSVASGLN